FTASTSRFLFVSFCAKRSDAGINKNPRRIIRFISLVFCDFYIADINIDCIGFPIGTPVLGCVGKTQVAELGACRYSFANTVIAIVFLEISYLGYLFVVDEKNSLSVVHFYHGMQARLFIGELP